MTALARFHTLGYQMKRIKHNDLTHYFLRPHSELPQDYLAGCEKFFRELGKKRNKFKASSSNATRHNLFTEIEAASSKLQATSTKRQASSSPAGLNDATIKK